jgi:pilus assembly protein FimV
MKIINKKRKSIIFIVAWVICINATALSLGPMKVLSVVGQPLRAEIEILSFSPLETYNLAIKLDSVQAHSQVGLNWQPFMSSISFDLAAGGAGRGPQIRIKSNDPVFVDKVGLMLMTETSLGKTKYEMTAQVPYPASSQGSNNVMQFMANR